MREKEVQFILQEGEGLRIEFKESFDRSLAKEMVAFANSSGGRILLGVDDEGRVKGIATTNRLRSQIQDVARNFDPSVGIELTSFEDIIIITVEEGKDKPYKCKEGFFIRIGPNSQKMGRDELINMIISEGKMRFDELADKEFVFGRDFDEEKLVHFLKLAGLSKALDSKEILLSLDVAKKEKEDFLFNNAGVLFFAKEPQRSIPWSVFTVALFKDKEGADIIDRKEIKGGLFEVVDNVIDFVRLYAKVAYKFTGEAQRENIYEYPIEALREAVINSVMHRDYFEHGHSNILKFFPDRIQIENVWLKPKNFVLGRTIFRRNPIIANLFSRIHFGEKLGSGMKRMEQYCKREKAPLPEIELTENYFYITFRPSETYLKMTEKLGEKWSGKWSERWSELTARQIAILRLIQETPRISRKELAERLKINQSAIQKHLQKLKQKGLLKRMGPARGGWWKITETGER